MKKALATVLSLIIIISTLSAFPFSANALNTSGTFGDNLRYSFDYSTGTLTISGSGDMPMEEGYRTPFAGQNIIKRIIINYGVTSIGNNAFSECSELKSVYIPDSVTKIGYDAFYNCTGLISISIPDSVTEIGNSAFHTCSGLKSLTLPNSDLKIGDYAFRECSSLTNLYIPANVSDIGKWTFLDCPGLTSIIVDSGNRVYDSRNDCNAIIKTEGDELIAGCMNTVIPGEIKKITAGAFMGCTGLKSITIPDSVTSIGNSAFNSCTGLTDITIPGSVTDFGLWVFCDCSSLSAVELQDGIENISESMFAGCVELKSITIPSSIKTVDEYAFHRCSNLSEIYCLGTQEQWNDITIDEGNDCLSNATIHFLGSDCEIVKGFLGDNIRYTLDSSTGTLTLSGSGEMRSFSYATETPFAYNEAIKDVIIENGITSISSYVFANCSSLESISIPSSVTNIDYSIFYNCPKVKSITVDSANKAYDSRNNCNAIIKKSNKELIIGCKNTVIPHGVTEIAMYAFEYCSDLTEIHIPNSVTTINSYAFSYCSSLTSIAIPESVTSIGSSAYINSTNIESITVDSNNTVYDSRDNCNAIIETNSNNLLLGCKNSFIPDSVTRIGGNAFYHCSGLKNITIPNGVTSIGTSAFNGCSGLTVLTIPCSVTVINAWAFSGCSGLTSITVDAENTVFDSRDNCNAIIYTSNNRLLFGCKNSFIPNGITGIASGAFHGCSELNEISIPNSVTNIGYSAFSDCSGLTQINIPDKVSVIEIFTFAGCSSLKNIHIPDSVTTIENNAFQSCSSLSEIVIPSSVRTIEHDAFWGCTGLSEIIIPDGVTSIGTYAFGSCTNLKSISLPDSVTHLEAFAFNNTAYYNDSSNWENDVLYIDNHLIEAKKSIRGLYAVKSGTKAIAYYAFYDCKRLTGVVIPDSVKTIELCAFLNCDGLKDVYYTGSKSEWNSIEFESDDDFRNVQMHFDYIVPCDVHTLGETVKENEIPSLCITEGSYDEVVYCSVCKSEISRQTIITELAEHTPAPAVIENAVAATYDREGHHELVVYCSVCHAELSRTKKTDEKLKRTDISKATVSQISNKTYTGKSITQKPIVKLKNKILVENKDYKLSFSNNKSVGKATITITGINAYSGKISKTFNIIPKGTSLSSLSAKSKGFTAKWSKQTTQTTGYEIQYATDSDFSKNKKSIVISKNSTVSKTVSKLNAKKKYYVRIRTYKTVKSTKYYSSWSKTKTVTTKK